MAYIEIYNNENSILIDDKALSHRLIKSGTSSAYQGFAMWSVVSCEYSLNLNTQSMPIVAWAPTSNTNGVYMSLHEIIQGSNNIYKWTYACGRKQIYGEYDYFMFQDGLSTPMNGTGLVVCRNSENVVVFDSDENYANLVDFVTVPLDGSVTKSYQSGRRYAVSNNVPLVKRVSTGPGGGWGNVYPIGASISGNIINFRHYAARDPQGTGSQGQTNGNAVSASFMVFDVTGL